MVSATVAERHQKPMDPAVYAKLLASKRAAESLVRREIKCPVCGFYLLDVYGRDHHLTRVKCRKCKFNEVIDTAYFRTMSPRRKNRIVRLKARSKPLR